MKGLGTALLQEGIPVIYVSTTLTPAEERYSSIERELLGVVFAMERLHNCLWWASSSSNRSQTIGDDLENEHCYSNPKTSKATSETCKVRDPVRVHPWKGQLDCRRTELSQSTYSKGSR